MGIGEVILYFLILGAMGYGMTETKNEKVQLVIAFLGILAMANVT